MNDGRMSEFFTSQELLVKQLSREIASHETLRHACEGLVVGISNHPRAAPGLEACMNAVSVGGSDRRRYHLHHGQRQYSTVSSSSYATAHATTKSFIGLVTLQTEDLVGLEPEGTTDAAQGVWQRRISTEWGGQGNLQSFATRAHQAWYLEHGLYYEMVPSGSPTNSPRNRRRVPRLVKRGGAKEDPGDIMVNVLALSLIVGYVAFHFQEEVSFLWNLMHVK